MSLSLSILDTEIIVFMCTTTIVGMIRNTIWVQSQENDSK